MKTLLCFLTLLSVCAFLFFFAQHHVREENSFRSCTLAEIYGEFAKDMSDLPSSRLGLILVLCAAGIVTAFYPALFVLLVRFVPHVGIWLILAGVIALLGAGANFLAMIISHTSFAFGGSSSSRTETFYLWLITAFQLAFAVSSIVLGSVSRWTNLVQNWLTN